MESFQDIEHFVKTLSAAIKKKIPTKVSQLTNDVGYKTTDTNTTYKLSKSGSTVTLTGSDGSTTSVTDDNATYSSLKNPYSLTIQNNGATVASYDGSTAKTVNLTNATASSAGLMSTSDKAKLDGIGAGSNVKSVNGKTGAVTLSKADVGLGNVDNTRDADKPYYKLIGRTATGTNKVGHFDFNDASESLYKIKNFYAASGEGDYFYLAHKKSAYTITATKHFSNIGGLFTADLSVDCTVATNLISESDPAILTIVRNGTITATDVLTLIFYEHRGWSSSARLSHWKLEVMAAGANASNYTKHTWKDGDWITVFERTNVSDSINRLWCCLNPYYDDGLGYLYIKGIRITIYAATPCSTKSGDFGYNLLEIAGIRLLDSRPSFSPAEALGALDVAGGTVYGKTTFQEGISATSYSGATATSSTDGLMSKSDKAKLDGIASSPSMLTNLGSTAAANVFQASPRPGVTGVLPIANGGTGASSLEGLRSNLDIETTLDTTCNILADNWVQDKTSLLYSNTVSVAGVKEGYVYDIDAYKGNLATSAEVEAYNNDFSCISGGYAEAEEGKITFTVVDKPAANITVRVKGTQVITTEETQSAEINNQKSTITDLQSKVAKITDKIYPVGSIYISVNSTSPADLFGGTWEQIKDRFLLAAGDSYAAGSTGGEAQHTLTVDEMPSHAHNFDNYISGYPPFSLGREGKDNYTMPLINILNPSDTMGAGQYTNAAGNSKPHNNMPPYLAVYMWKRVS